MTPTTNSTATKKELMQWHRTCIRLGHYTTAALIMSALTKVLPTQGLPSGYLLYIASYNTEAHKSGFAAYVATTFKEHTNVLGRMSHKDSDSGSIATRLIRLTDEAY